MPVISIDFRDLQSLLGKPISKDEFIERIPMIGSDVERVEGDEIDIEFFPNRPDLYSVEGIARAARAFLGIRPGMVTYDVAKPEIEMHVDDSVNEVRPYVVAAKINDVEFSDFFIKSLMNVQEKLHDTLGRGRKKVAIGLHDADQVEPPYYYKAVDPESVSFVPLDKQEEMDMREILRKHEKGIKYAHILEDFSRWPIILDKNDEVLSFPPIINGELTAVKEGTESIFIDMTGTDLNALTHCLSIMCAIFADRGGQIESVTLVYPDRKIVLPNMHPRAMKVKLAYINRLLGLELDADGASTALERMGFDTREKGHELEVSIPAYRGDLLHPIDIVEDVAIGYGYDRFEPAMPQSLSFGLGRPIETSSQRVREAFVGLGYLEIATLTLSNDRDQFTRLGAETGKRSQVLNPLTTEYTNLRVSLLPSLLMTLQRNKHRDYPQKIFEVGDTVLGNKNRRHAAAASCHSTASFTEIKSVAQRVLEDLRLDFRFEKAERPGFIPGRSASIILGNDIAGHFGEIHPGTLENFELTNPVAALVLDLELFR